ncbi:hypothetical protein [Streptomyces sp. NPDC005423]|uniref:hypothetical protein n=1 Tax=Streptomyces sp. NPDC005423 TaxID=3155343 RepID=UPI0033BB5AB5
MTARTDKRKAENQPPETGWAKARRLRAKGVRTCVPSVQDRGAETSAHPGSEGNIVRGDD